MSQVNGKTMMAETIQ